MKNIEIYGIWIIPGIFKNQIFHILGIWIWNIPKKSATRKIQNFLKYEYSWNIPKIVKIQNIEYFGIWNITLNIPKIFPKLQNKLWGRKVYSGAACVVQG